MDLKQLLERFEKGKVFGHDVIDLAAKHDLQAGEMGFALVSILVTHEGITGISLQPLIDECRKELQLLKALKDKETTH